MLNCFAIAAFLPRNRLLLRRLRQSLSVIGVAALATFAGEKCLIVLPQQSPSADEYSLTLALTLIMASEVARRVSLIVVFITSNLTAGLIAGPARNTKAPFHRHGDGGGSRA